MSLIQPAKDNTDVVKQVQNLSITNSTQSNKLYNDVFKSREHILEMLEDRGYDVSHLLGYEPDNIKTMLIEHNNGKFEISDEVGPLDIYLEKTIGSSSLDKQKIYVKYRLDNKFKSNNSIITQIDTIFEKHLTIKDTLIILNLNRIEFKPGVKDKSDEDFCNRYYITKNYFIQLFGLENFLFNVSKNKFVPKHTILSKQKTQELFANYNCSYKNIPTIKRDDAQAKYIGLRPKQICEIQVENASSGITTRYRYCDS